MAVILVEGFDTYNGTGNTLTAPGLQSRWTLSGTISLAPIAMVAGRFGGQAINSLSNIYGSCSIVRNLGASYSSGTVGLALWISRYPSTAYAVASFCVGVGTDAATIQSSLRVFPDGSLGVVNSAGTLIGGTAASLLPVTGWCYVEFSLFVSDTVGTAAISVNGVNEYSGTGLDTKSQTATTFDTIRLGTFDISNANISIYIDDVYVTDTTSPLGEQRVCTTYVDADSSNIAWAPNSGSTLYTQIDETLCDGDTSYIYSGTLNADATFNVQDLPVVPSDVQAVQIGSFARKTDTGARSIALQYETPGGAQYNSSNFVLSGSYVRQINLLLTNPSTGSPWTATEINNMKVGVKVTA